MRVEVLSGLLIPFMGTSLGAAVVFFVKGKLHDLFQRALIGFAAGVMVAASIWSLLIPSLEQAAGGGALSVLPTVTGFWIGILFLLFLDKLIPHLHMKSNEAEGPSGNFNKVLLLVLAVALHNIPEGMAVGVVYAGWLSDAGNITLSEALALAIGIAIQNFPEGAIISLPLTMQGVSKGKALWYGVLSGVVEPLGAFFTILASGWLIAWLPGLLSFAAGAMLYVVVEELIPEMSEGKHSDVGTLMFGAGFSLMMILDVLLG
ncbi:MAG: ZIP family metal transporter [Roseburia sp.]|nr:ZIP family metal transporter [Roseburia sp.]